MLQRHLFGSIFDRRCVYTFTLITKSVHRNALLNLESLEIRRLRLDLLLTYKILFGMADIDFHKLFCLRANIKPARGHGFKLVQEQFKTQRRRSFFVNVLSMSGTVFQFL